MLFDDGMFFDKEKEQVVFLNTFSLNEHIKLLQAVLEHTISDLSIISGINKEELLNDYIYMHDYDPFREIRKKKGMYDEKKEMKSSALIEYERKHMNEETVRDKEIRIWK